MATQPGGSVTSRAASESRSGAPGSSGSAPGNNTAQTATGAKFRHGLLQLMIHTIDPLHDGKAHSQLCLSFSSLLIVPLLLATKLDHSKHLSFVNLSNLSKQMFVHYSLQSKSLLPSPFINESSRQEDKQNLFFSCCKF